LVARQDKNIGGIKMTTPVAPRSKGEEEMISAIKRFITRWYRILWDAKHNWHKDHWGNMTDKYWRGE
jgi:hypothetical protein